MLIVAAALLLLGLAIVAASIVVAPAIATRRVADELETRPGLLEQLEAEPIVVNLVDDRAIAGFLAHARPDALLLRAARYVGDAGSYAAEGEIVIPLGRIAWVQRGIRIDDVGGPA